MYLHIYVFVLIIHNGFRSSSHYVDRTFGNRIRQAWPRWEWSWQRPLLSCLLILVTYCLCGFCCQVPSVHLYSGLPWLSVVGIVFLPSLCLSLFGSFTHSIPSPIKWKNTSTHPSFSSFMFTCICLCVFPHLFCFRNSMQLLSWMLWYINSLMIFCILMVFIFFLKNFRRFPYS